MPAPPTVRTARLADGLMGLWDERTRTVWLDAALTGAERRSTLAHELVHAARGDVPCRDPVLAARQELVVERIAARQLLPLHRLADALRWTRDRAELAALLDVDPAMLRARLTGLTGSERAVLDRAVPDES